MVKIDFYADISVLTINAELNDRIMYFNNS